MARFYDRLRGEEGETIEHDLRAKLGGAFILDASNLSDFLYANEAKGEWDLIRDFFNLAPPFEKFFVECKAPRQLLTKKGMIPWPQHLPKEWGVLFLATEVTKETQSDCDRVLGMTEGSPEGIRWVIQAILFAETPETANGMYNGKLREQYTWWFPVLGDGSQPTGEPRSRCMKIEYVVDKELNKLMNIKDPTFVPLAPGSDKGVVEMTDDMFSLVNVRNVDSACRFWNPNGEVRLPLDKPMDDASWEAMRNGTTDSYVKVMSLREDIPSMKPEWQFHYTLVEEQHWLPLLQPCLMSVCFMHVKNVTTERIEPAKALQKKRERRGREPLCTYHVLKVQPFKQVLESEGHTSTSGIRRALSICKGHFHHYGEKWGKGKLFGKYEGSFYIPPHMKGSIDLGIREKDYKIERPKSKAS